MKHKFSYTIIQQNWLPMLLNTNTTCYLVFVINTLAVLMCSGSLQFDLNQICTQILQLAQCMSFQLSRYNYLLDSITRFHFSHPVMLFSVSICLLCITGKNSGKSSTYCQVLDFLITFSSTLFFYSLTQNQKQKHIVLLHCDK